MNDGYIAIWFMMMGVILYMTGWNELVADQLSRRMLSLFIIGVFTLQFFEIPLSNVLSIKASAVLTIVVALYALFSLRRAGTIMFVGVCSLMIGIIWLWIRSMYIADPVFILLRPAWDGPLIAGLLTGLLCDRLRTQFAAVVIAAVIGSFHLNLHPSIGLQHQIVGALAWWDGIAIALVTARLMGHLKGWLRPKSLRFLEDPFGQKRGN
ncbi:hypothetical protein Back11_23610 [Paenibacillus baekrokdamisoli]|uniref:Uncharacterized protein n=1 Tax=Paenibacillus baekrokdamisoli TaxID=1712516 RepID=A0A3G9IRI6_9BACL|nr:hypothetical protein [Paenibacillus baekrokdamisoli]MBB3069630.1 hypothetical protein [Paenibacillus baekrokdamisoli]BBH21016.1 hypothetical protein Back11_23610 [Paenibacillus baekrokdamisoli]